MTRSVLAPWAAAGLLALALVLYASGLHVPAVVMLILGVAALWTGQILAQRRR